MIIAQFPVGVNNEDFGRYCGVLAQHLLFKCMGWDWGLDELVRFHRVLVGCFIHGNILYDNDSDYSASCLYFSEQME